jgi:zinc protease
MLPSAALPPEGGRVTTLANGLRVIVRDVPAAPVVSVWCWYRAGSRDDLPGRTGAAHWVEHLNFKGTARIPRGRFNGLVERLGGTWNAYTWLDQTAYFETAEPGTLPQLLFLEAERMSSSLFDPQDCEIERTVVLAELDGCENDPEWVLETEVTAAALRVHPYRQPTIGWRPDLERMTRDDLFGYYRRHYAPNAATLVVAGPVNPDDVLAQAEEAFRACEPRPVPARTPVVEPPAVGERRVLIARPGTTAFIKLAVQAPAVSHPDFAALLVVDAVLTGAKGVNVWSAHRGAVPNRRAWLYRVLVEGGLASSVSGALAPTADPFLFVIAATATTGTPLDALEEAIVSEIERLRGGGMADDELRRTKRQLAARFALENDGVTAIAHQLGYFDVVSSVDEYLSLPGRVAGVTLDDVRRVAERWLAPACRTVGRFTPLPLEGAS